MLARRTATMSVLIGLLFGLLPACNIDEPPALSRPSAAAIEPEPSPSLGRLTAIVRHRGSCYGTCPVDLLVVHGDGEVVYIGERSVERLGAHTGWVAPHRLGDVVERLIEGDYAGVEARNTSGRTDQATVITSVVLDGRRHVIEDDGESAPPVAQALNADLDGLLEHVRWDPEPPLIDAAAADAWACVELRERTAAACFDFAAGEIEAGPCTLFAPIARSTRGGHVPGELCLEFLDVFESAEPRPGFGVLRHGPACAVYVGTSVSRCRDTLLGRPVARDHDACASLLAGVELLLSPITDRMDPEERADVLRINEYLCERWI